LDYPRCVMETKKILINASVLNIGGGLHYSVKFIKKCYLDNENIQWFYAVNKFVYKLLPNEIKNTIHDRLIIVDSPASFSKFIKTNRKINNFIQLNSIDLIYSIGSPSYIFTSISQVHRLTNPYLTNLSKKAVSNYKYFKKLKIIIKSIIQRFIIYNYNYVITQTDYANSIYKKIIPNSSVFTIPNALSDEIFKFNIKKSYDLKTNNIFKIAFITSYYPHKNVESIFQLISHLNSTNIKGNYEIYITLERDDLNDFESLSYVKYLGKLNQLQIAELIDSSNCVYLPTDLETFSSTIIESVFLNRPIVLTNYQFNKVVDSELLKFFEAQDWKGAAKKIYEIYCDKNVRQPCLPINFFQFTMDYNYTKTKDILLNEIQI
jgi:hypothetical protein